MKFSLTSKSTRQFIKYQLLGGGGTVVNLGTIFMLTYHAGLHYLISGVISYVLAMSFNYIIHRRFTFNIKSKKDFTKNYFQFLTLGIIGTLVSFTFLYIFTEFVGIYYVLSQFFSSAFSSSTVFFLTKHWIFKK